MHRWRANDMGYCRLLWDLFQLKRNEHKTRGQIQALQEKKLRKHDEKEVRNAV